MWVLATDHVRFHVAPSVRCAAAVILMFKPRGSAADKDPLLMSAAPDWSAVPPSPQFFFSSHLLTPASAPVKWPGRQFLDTYTRDVLSLSRFYCYALLCCRVVFFSAGVQLLQVAPFWNKAESEIDLC